MTDAQPRPAASRTRLFYSYASQDGPLHAELAKHLAALRQYGGVMDWHARQIPAGLDRDEESERHLQQAEVILLLLSADYLASDYCRDVEAEVALERHRRAEAWTIPVLLSPVDLHGSPFGQLQLLPSDAKPVTLWRDRDRAWLDIVQGIRRAIAGLPARAPAQGPLIGLEQDEAGAALYLCSELLGFSVPLRLSLERPVATQLDRIVRGLGLPERLDFDSAQRSGAPSIEDQDGRTGVSCRYQLAHGDRALVRRKTLAEQGVRGGDALVLEVVTSLLAAKTHAGSGGWHRIWAWGSVVAKWSEFSARRRPGWSAGTPGSGCRRPTRSSLRPAAAPQRSDTTCFHSSPAGPASPRCCCIRPGSSEAGWESR